MEMQVAVDIADIEQSNRPVAFAVLSHQLATERQRPATPRSEQLLQDFRMYMRPDRAPLDPLAPPPKPAPVSTPGLSNAANTTATSTVAPKYDSDPQLSRGIEAYKRARGEL
jgi:hypothetical protein